MSILRSKHSGWTWEGRRTPFGGGSSGSSQPTQSTSDQTNVPEYAKPYVETMLGAAQKQAYKYDNAGNIVGFQPYVPYGATVDASGNITNTAQEQAKAAVAGFSPMQEQAFGQVANLQVPGQYGAGSQFVGAGGMGGGGSTTGNGGNGGKGSPGTGGGGGGAGQGATGVAVGGNGGRGGDGFVIITTSL